MTKKQETENGEISRQRLSPIARRNQILTEATKFFAEFGFNGTTRELADKIGVKQPLIYQYFASKEELVKEVCAAVFEKQFSEEWHGLLKDHSVDIQSRISKFYQRLLTSSFQQAEIRLFLFSGLARLDSSRQFVHFVETKILSELACELRSYFGQAPLSKVPLNQNELEVLWLFHGGVCFHAIRTEIFQASDAGSDVSNFISSTVRWLIQIYPHQNI